MASPLAASLVSLSKPEKIQGCVLANIGSETVSIIVYENDIPISIEVFKVGSNDITNDIALGLQISLDDAQKIKSILGEFISKNALSDGIDTARIQENWSSIMGENISAYTKEVSLQQDVLIVKLNSSVLRQELSYGKEKIIEMINKSLGKEKIKDIRFI